MSYYNNPSLDPFYYTDKSPIPKIKGIPDVTRDYRFWLNPNRNSEEKYQYNPKFYTYQLDKFNDINSRLEDLIYDDGDLNQPTNIMGYHTEYNLHMKNNFFNVLIDWVHKKIHEIDTDIKNIEIINMWGLVHSKGDYTQPHDHELKSISSGYSWVYYVNVDDECSNLVFTMSNEVVKPNNGLLVVFPLHLVHHVPIQEVNYNRVSISGNSKIIK